VTKEATHSMRGQTGEATAPETAGPEVSADGWVANALYAGLRGLGLFPLPVRRLVGRILGRVVSVIPTSDRRIAELQLRLTLPELHLRKTIASTFGNLGCSTLETLNLQPILNDHKRLIEVSGEQIVQETSESQGPLIALTAHLGNWDLLAAYMALRGIRLATIGREARSGALQYVLARLRARYQVRTIWRKKSSGKEIISLLKKGWVVAALIDQDTRVSSLPIPFFNIPAATPDSLVEIALRMNIPMASAFLVRVYVSAKQFWFLLIAVIPKLKN
jgi:Kdo2-lipid IVA lauroyltransferase/acyltransferase